MDPGLARTIWVHLETINAVAYFSAEARDLPARLGLRGFWMGYFASRAAPMGAVGAGVVEATFVNFHHDHVARAVPQAWQLASPEQVLRERALSCAAALRRLLGDPEAQRLASEVNPTLRAAISAGTPAGRPLFAANRGIEPVTDPVGALWQAATTLREHRGDAHVALLVGAGLDGCEAHVLHAAETGTAADLYLQTRGWSPEDWSGAIERLAGRGLLGSDGGLTGAGQGLRREIERRTDELAVGPYEALGVEGCDRLIRACAPATERVAAAGEIIYPNPMGLPRSA